MGMQVSFQPLMPRTGPELWTLFIPPSSRGHYLSYRRAGTLSPKEEWPAGEELPSAWPLCALCFVPRLLRQPLEGMPPVYSPTLLGARRNLPNIRQ